MIARTHRHIPILLAVIASLAMIAAGKQTSVPKAKKAESVIRVNGPLAEVEGSSETAKTKAADDTATPSKAVDPLIPEPGQVIKSLQTVGLLAIVSLAPAAVLMVTAFVRINIVLLLLRQALGSPQVPGNQVLTALALMLTALVMRPVGETVYKTAVVPYANNTIAWDEAYRRASQPVKTFMIAQIERSNHTDYLWDLLDEVTPESQGSRRPVYGDEFPMRVVAPAYLLSEITTGLIIGFFLYLPFLAVDLVVSAVLAAMGLFMMPPSLVALPLKLILFVMIDGWLLVATKLLQSFGPLTG